MRKLLSISMAIALILSIGIVPRISSAAPGDAQLQLQVIEIAGPSIEGTVGASSLIKLVKGEKYQLRFRITMIPPTGSEVRVRFPQSSIALTVNGTAVPFRHRELYKYLTPKGGGEFLVTDCFAEFIPDSSGVANLEIKGNNVAGGTPIESKATAVYNYIPSTYAEIITHQMRVEHSPSYGDFASQRIFDYGESVYPTHLIDNGSEVWDIGSGITFSRTNPPRTKVLFYDSFTNRESEVELAYCQATVGGILRAVRFRYLDNSIDDYLMLDNGAGSVLCEMLISCPEDSYPGDDPVPDIHDAIHSVYCVTDPAAVQGFFNQDDTTINDPIYNVGEVSHGGVIPDLMTRLPALPSGAIGWTENGADLYQFSALVTRRILLYPLFPQEASPFSVITYVVGDADFYWAYGDLYGGLRAEPTIETPAEPIPNDSSLIFSHWIDEQGNAVDFNIGIPSHDSAVYQAVYVKKDSDPSNPNPPTTPIPTTSVQDDSGDGGVDYFPPITTTTKEGDDFGTSPVNPTTTDATGATTDSGGSTSVATTAPTPTPVSTTPLATDIDEDNVPLGLVTTTTSTTTAPAVTGITNANVAATTTEANLANIDLPVTGFTANEVFWIGGGMIVLLGAILLVANKKNDNKVR